VSSGCELLDIGAIYAHGIESPILRDWVLSLGTFLLLLGPMHCGCLPQDSTSSTQITGSIPTELGLLANLTMLGLGKSAFYR
jgi:hypothetical protein